jgi:hypothetical protein
MQSDKAYCNPDSLLISSEFPIPDSINTILMEPLTIKSNGDTVNQEIKFKKLKNIFVEPTPTNLIIPIEGATEKTLTVPVTCNQSNRQFKFIPSVISLQFKVPISKFDKITSADFTANAKYSDNGKSKAVIEITKKPEWIDHLMWTPASVDYFHQNP